MDAQELGNDSSKQMIFVELRLFNNITGIAILVIPGLT